MVALLPTDTSWCKIALPHLTIVYAGEIEDRNPTDFNILAKEVAMVAALVPPIFAKVFGVEVLGDEDKVNVLTIEPTPQLKALRSMFEMWNKSEYEFKPHCTIGPAIEPYSPDTLPFTLLFDRIMVGWGEQQINFWLK